MIGWWGGRGRAGMGPARGASRRGVDVPLLTKVHPLRSHSAAAQGGINAAVQEDDSWEKHAFDTVKGGDYLNDQDAVEASAREAPGDIVEVERMAPVFTRREDGRLATRPFGGAGASRACFIADITGTAILHVVWEQLQRTGVHNFDEWFCASLLVDEGVCKGVVAMEMMTGLL